MNLDGLEKKVQIYNKLPDQQKIGDNYKKIKSHVNAYKKKLNILLQTIEEPDNYLDDQNSDTCMSEKEFLIAIENIEKLKKNILEQKHLDKMANMYLELYQLCYNCKYYLENKKMEIEYLDQN